MILGTQVHQRVGADDVILVGIERFAGPDDRVPIARRRILGLVLSGGMRIAGEEVHDEDDVVFVGGKLAVRLPADADLLDHLAADSGVGRHFEGVLRHGIVIGSRRRDKQQRRERA